MVSVHLHFLLTELGKEVGSDFSTPSAFFFFSFRVQQRSGQRVGRCHLISAFLRLQPPKLRTERTKKSTKQNLPNKPVPLRQFMMAATMRKN